MVKDILLAGAGGFIGSALRYAVSAALLSFSGQYGFPVGTLLVNALGSLLIGIMWVLLPAGGWQTFAVAGFCGGFTTFSAFSLEAFKMLHGGQSALAAVYAGISVLLCMLFVWAGVALTRRMVA